MTKTSVCIINVYIVRIIKAQLGNENLIDKAQDDVEQLHNSFNALLFTDDHLFTKTKNKYIILSY